MRLVHFGFDGFFPDAALVDQFHGEVMKSVIVHLFTDSEFVKEFSMLLEVSVSQVFGLAYTVGVIFGQCKHCKSHSYSQRFSLAWFQFNNIAFKISIFLVLSSSDAQHPENTNDLRNMRNGHCALYIQISDILEHFLPFSTCNNGKNVSNHFDIIFFRLLLGPAGEVWRMKIDLIFGSIN